MPRLYVRVSEGMNKKAEIRAKELGFTKKDGKSNISQYLRWLIENDENPGSVICERCDEIFAGNKLFADTKYANICSECLSNEEKQKMLSNLETS